MTDIKWGPAIAVDGKRPEWLGEFADRIGYERQGDGWYGPHPRYPDLWSEEDILNNKGGWETVTAIRLPADHPHYRQTEAAGETYIDCVRNMKKARFMDLMAAIPEGMKPWHGGDAAPADWDNSKPVRLRDGREIAEPASWTHPWRNGCPEGELTGTDEVASDVVAYTPLAAPIDWSGELEAVHEDGRTIGVKVTREGSDGARHVAASCSQPPKDWEDGYHKFDGTSFAPDDPWRIRNVPQPTPQADTKPDLTARDDMEKLVRDLAASDTRGCFAVRARAIVALLPDPVDPLEEAKTVLDVFLAAYQAMPDTTLVERGPGDDLLTYGHLRTILRALALAGEKEA